MVPITITVIVIIIIIIIFRHYAVTLTKVGAAMGLTTPNIWMMLVCRRSDMAFNRSITSSQSDSFFVSEPVGNSRAATITCEHYNDY